MNNAVGSAIATTSGIVRIVVAACAEWFREAQRVGVSNDLTTQAAAAGLVGVANGVADLLKQLGLCLGGLGCHSVSNAKLHLPGEVCYTHLAAGEHNISLRTRSTRGAFWCPESMQKTHVGNREPLGTGRML